MTALATPAAVILFALGMAAAVLLLIFVLVPLFKGLGWLILHMFKAIGWLFAHVFEFIGGMIGDVIRFIGALIATVVLAPMAILNVLIGRWSAAGHFADSVRRELAVLGGCLYRVALRRPLKLVMLHGLLEGVEQRVPEAMAAAPTSDRPSKRVGQFPGYTIVGSLRGGGSGAKLFIAAPDDSIRQRYPSMPERVVVKCFALSEGSTLPQMLRESRALECAKQLGLVFDHSMDEHRFYYVMPYHDGDHLGIITRQLHGQSGADGLGSRQLGQMLGYVGDLVETLAVYHRGGLWHKDVKPDNVIVHSGRAHLVDLGLVTPLRSAMTLTTHGTEYFRDPEMVRQALRGVKVHQINGAKFDIYAVGALMYFMIENTFPPHGALSRFQRRSPDTLRWIVRRAMADYSHRYETADEMLADIRYVAMAADPYAVRPAELPSVSGETPPPLPMETPVAAAVGSPVPPASDADPMPAPAEPVAPAAAAVSAVGAAMLPKLEVTNWWTGAYRVTTPAAAASVTPAATPATPVDPDHFREQARALRHDTAQLRRQVRSGRLNARKAAREQVRLARRRAQEIRRRTRAHRKARAERQPSFMLLALGFITLVGLGGALVAAIASARQSSSHTVVISEDPGLPVLIVDAVDDPDAGRAQWLHAIAERYESDGYDVIPNMSEASEHLHSLIGTWQHARHVDHEAYKAADRALELALDQLNLYGFVYVTDSSRGLDADLIYSEAKDAGMRRHAAAIEAPPSQMPYLIINDHPTSHVPTTATSLAERINEYQLRGWVVTTDNELEADVRKLLPPLPIEPDVVLPERLSVTLGAAGYGGILYVTADPGEGPAAERVDIHVITVPPAPKYDEAAGSHNTTQPMRTAA